MSNQVNLTKNTTYIYIQRRIIDKQYHIHTTHLFVHYSTLNVLEFILNFYILWKNLFIMPKYQYLKKKCFKTLFKCFIGLLFS